MRRTWIRACLIVVVGTALGLLANTVSPRRIAWITPPKPVVQPEQLLSLEQARELWGASTAFFLDARAPDDYAAGHIARALSLPADDFEKHFPNLAPLLAPDSLLVVYCDGSECELSHRLADRLKQLDFQQIRILTNGWTVWTNASLPVEKGSAP
jgi:rhodanese-related sulfurtransferase